MTLKNNQRNKVLELRNLSYDILDQSNLDKKIFFSAPTGSGKTFILSNLIWDLINKYEKIVVFFVSLSTGQIEKQNFDNYKKYKKNSAKNIDLHFCSYLKSEKNISTSSIKDIKNVNIFSSYPKQVYFLGTQLFSKQTLLYKNKILENELKIFKEKKYKIVYIRDEAHISKSSIYDKTSSENLNNLFQDYSDCSIFCSATINSLMSNSNTVIFSEEEAIDDCLIKEDLKSFYGIQDNSIITSEELTKISIDNFIQQQEKYKSLDININPALLIQIPSKSNIHNVTRERSLIKFLISEIRNKNLNYVVWCDDFYSDIQPTNIPELKDKNNAFIRDFISKNDSIVDIIIFKVALAIGWDIPRANSLLQLRELHSDDLNIQTIGRIRRNPLYPLDKIKENIYNFCNEYFVYTNNISSDIKLKQISLKEQFHDFKIKHPKTMNTLINFNESLFSNNLNKLLLQIINQDFFSNDVSNKHILQQTKKIKIHILTNQYFWLNHFFEHYSSLLDYKIFDIFYKMLNVWITDNNLLKYKHKIYRKIIEESSSFIKLVNDSMDIKYFDNYNFLEDHSLPKITQVELVFSKPSKLNFVNARQTLSLNNFHCNSLDVEKKWGYNEVIQRINEFKISNVESINDIQLDSNGEYDCCTSILNWISSDSKNYQQTKLFTKHYISSSLIKYPYIFSKQNEICRVHNTYPDFFLILERKDSELIVIIEVKSKNQDYNYEKTNAIRQMFINLSKKIEFKNYYFCIYLYSNNTQSRHDIQVWNKGKKMEFYDMSTFLNLIAR